MAVELKFTKLRLSKSPNKVTKNIFNKHILLKYNIKILK